MSDQILFSDYQKLHTECVNLHNENAKLKVDNIKLSTALDEIMRFIQGYALALPDSYARLHLISKIDIYFNGQK